MPVSFALWKSTIGSSFTHSLQLSLNICNRVPCLSIMAFLCAFVVLPNTAEKTLSTLRQHHNNQLRLARCLYLVDI